MFKNIRGDLFGGITAGVVALPLALAFGVQSGLGAEAGLYGAIALGFFAALLGGTGTQVSGPTGPMTVISSMVIASAIEISGSLPAGMGIIIGSFVLSGALQVVFGLLKIGKYIKYIPYPVLSGFMTGIGVIIIIFQIYPFMGHASEKTAIGVFANILTPISNMNWSSFLLGGATIAIIYLFPRITKVVPSTLVALILCTVASAAMGLEDKYGVPTIGQMPEGMPDLRVDELLNVDMDNLWLIFEFALMLSALGVIDSLLTSVIADNITKTKHSSNKELIGQGIGNMVAGAIGGLPGAGATMRTVVNINAGGKTRISGAIHSVLLFAILLGLGTYAAHIPKSVLAGILITVGIGIIDYKGLKDLTKTPKTSAFILLLVLGVTVFGNLINAVVIGVILASIFYMKNTSDLVEANTVVRPLSEDTQEGVYVKELHGSLFFGVSSYFKELLEGFEGISRVVIQLCKVPYIDQSGIYAMEDVIQKLKSDNIEVYIVGALDQPSMMLDRFGIISNLVPSENVFDTMKEFKDKISK